MLFASSADKTCCARHHMKNMAKVILWIKPVEFQKKIQRNSENPEIVYYKC